MQLVQTRTRLATPLVTALTCCRFGFQRRRVTLCACEMLLPNCGPLPQSSHTCAMVHLQTNRFGRRVSRKHGPYPDFVWAEVVGTIGVKPLPLPGQAHPQAA